MPGVQLTHRHTHTPNHRPKSIFCRHVQNCNSALAQSQQVRCLQFCLAINAMYCVLPTNLNKLFSTRKLLKEVIVALIFAEKKVGPSVWKSVISNQALPHIYCYKQKQYYHKQSFQEVWSRPVLPDQRSQQVLSLCSECSHFLVLFGSIETLQVRAVWGRMEERLVGVVKENIQGRGKRSRTQTRNRGHQESSDK